MVRADVAETGWERACRRWFSAAPVLRYDARAWTHRDPPELFLRLVFGRQLSRDQKKEIPNEQFERACLNVDVIKGRVRLIAVDEPAS